MCWIRFVQSLIVKMLILTSGQLALYNLRTRASQSFLLMLKRTLMISHAVNQMFDCILTWLILPVVICLSQRLSHASLSISIYTVKLRKAHYISYSLFDGTPTTWITVVILELIHAQVRRLFGAVDLLDQEPTLLAGLS